MESRGRTGARLIPALPVESYRVQTSRSERARTSLFDIGDNQMNVEPIHVSFDQPINGYWDGGLKSGGDFEPEQVEHPGPGNFIRWGCWYLNFWYTSKAGRTWKEARSIAKRTLVNLIHVRALVK